MNNTQKAKDEIDLDIQTGFEKIYDLIIKTGVSFFHCHPTNDRSEQMEVAYSTLIFFMDEEDYTKSGQIQKIINEYTFGFTQMRKACGIDEAKYKF